MFRKDPVEKIINEIRALSQSDIDALNMVLERSYKEFPHTMYLLHKYIYRFVLHYGDTDKGYTGLSS